MSIDIRRRTIVKTRQALHDLYKYEEDLEKTKPINLKIRKANSFYLHKNNFSSDSLSLGSSISSVKGIGSKQVERLSGLGLISIRDLINYFPRDYGDYTSLKTINQTQPGHNATIVAKIRRCNSFKSPKNHNLSILELFIKDKTGGMKITRFFAGRRFSNKAYFACYYLYFMILRKRIIATKAMYDIYYYKYTVYILSLKSYVMYYAITYT